MNDLSMQDEEFLEDIKDLSEEKKNSIIAYVKDKVEATKSTHLKVKLMGDKIRFVIEAKSEDEANNVNLDLYRFEKYSETKDCYIFIRRRGT